MEVKGHISLFNGLINYSAHYNWKVLAIGERFVLTSFITHIAINQLIHLFLICGKFSDRRKRKNELLANLFFKG